jgi:hypothetical protein
MRIRIQLNFGADPDFYLMRIRIEVTKMMCIRDKRPGSVPTCHGSATLQETDPDSEKKPTKEVKN